MVLGLSRSFERRCPAVFNAPRPNARSNFALTSFDVDARSFEAARVVPGTNIIVGFTNAMNGDIAGGTQTHIHSLLFLRITSEARATENLWESRGHHITPRSVCQQSSVVKHVRCTVSVHAVRELFFAATGAPPRSAGLT